MLPPAHRIAAIVPQYTAAGDTTVILTTDGERLTQNRRVKSILTGLARAHAIDLCSLRRNSSRSTGCALHQPLPVAPGLVLVPVKARKPKVAGDNCTGYVNYYAVASYALQPGNPQISRVELTGGHSLEVCWTVKTIKKSLRTAKLAISDTALAAPQHPHMQPLAVKLVEVISEILNLRLEHPAKAAYPQQVSARQATGGR